MPISQLSSFDDGPQSSKSPNASHNPVVETLFRSETMHLYQFIVRNEALYDCVAELGTVGAVQFRDVSYRLSAPITITQLCAKRTKSQSENPKLIDVKPWRSVA